MHKLCTFVLIDNEVAIEIEKKFGFKFEGVVKEHICQDRSYKDVYYVSLYKAEFIRRNLVVSKDLILSG